MIPIVLCGGSGTRLWPVSRRSFPKQFNKLVDGSLLQRTLRRVSALGEPRVVATKDTAVLTRRALAEQGIDPDRAVFEPTGRNTAPAVALAVHRLREEDLGDQVVGVFPADHLVEDEPAFRDAVALAAECARRGRVVTLGIRPTSPATGYGYIEVTDEVFATGFASTRGPATGGSDAEEIDSVPTAYTTAGFREKPDPATARRFLAEGRFFWNSGMFVFRTDDMAGHFERLMPELWRAVSRVELDLSNLEETYRNLPSQSLDYGIMEPLEEQVCIPCSIGWSDLGSWDEVARLRASSPAAVEVAGAADNFVFGYRDKVYGLVDVEDLVVVDTADATLITRRGSTQKVKELVEKLRRDGRREADEHAFEHRPWGSFEVLRDTDDFKSKILRVAPRQRLSYQSHQHRSEHWVVVKGNPEVVLDGEVLRPRPGEAVYIPRGARHRIANPTDDWVEIVEVQLGTYFGEDDIVRYEDDYDRA
jgi:mannose-1-phosphate guanylyltransferase/mannose-6-phosphate isomerase